MKIKLLLLSGICLFAFFSGLVILSILAQKDRNLFFIFPVELSAAKIDIEDIEEFSASEFLLTYENFSPTRLSLFYGDFPVTLVETNSAYPQIMGLLMLDGSFFTGQAWTGRQRHAVLNEEAAISIYGSYNIAGSFFRMQNETWIITGIIDDGRERSQIYIPSSIRGGTVGELALIAQDDAVIKNGTRSLGLREQDFFFLNLETQFRLLRERAVLVPILFLTLLFLSLLWPQIKKFRKAWQTLKVSLSRHYIRDILSGSLKSEKKALFLFAFDALILAALPALALLLFLRIASIVLPWQDIPSLSGINPELFYPHLLRISNISLISMVLFILSLIFSALFLLHIMFIMRKLPKPTQAGTNG